MKERRCVKKGGFSLVEVCLAVLVVGLGLLSIFSVFPTGLAASESAAADTETSLFAEQVLWGLQATASDLTGDFGKWNNLNNYIVKDIDGSTKITINGAPALSKANIQYVLTIPPTPPSRMDKVKEVTLFAASLKTAPIVTNVFYTELYYTELP